jgi:hypothetical protein
MGGDAAVQFAERLEEAHVPVSPLVTYDPNRFAHSVPSNVRRYINLYQSSKVLGRWSAGQLTYRYTRRGCDCARPMNLFGLATSLLNQRQKPAVNRSEPASLFSLVDEQICFCDSFLYKHLHVRILTIPNIPFGLLQRCVEAIQDFVDTACSDTAVCNP